MPADHTPTIASLGEVGLIERIRRWLGPAGADAPLGIGDDCAVLPQSRRRRLVTVDPVIRGRHFDDTAPPAQVGAKLLKRNLSDIAAMGGRPTHAVLALAAPSDLPVAWLRAFFSGLRRCALAHGVRIVGGDCARTDGFLGATLTLFGDAPRRPLLRTGARIGDLLLVTGGLGGSRLGRHHRFTPRLPEGAWLATRPGVHAAIDLSDGLGKDLRHLVPAGACALIETDRLPIARDARRAARASGRPVLSHVLNDGEDYELLLAVAPRAAPALVAGWRRRFRTALTGIGRLVAGRAGAAGIRFDPPLPEGIDVRGYEHFR